MKRIDRRIKPLTHVKIEGIPCWQTVKKVIDDKWITLDEYVGHFHMGHISVFSNKFKIKKGQSIKKYLGI